jgi:hypothetical protein
MPREDLLKAIVDAINGLRYGAVEITVHDGQVVQIERREKVRPGPGRLSTSWVSTAQPPEGGRHSTPSTDPRTDRTDRRFP